MTLESKLPSSLDRFEEGHFHLHAMQRFYHHADEFRWTLGCFTRALKEVPQLVQMELQGQPGFSAWWKPKRRELMADPLIDFFRKRRDEIVHRRMLVPASSGAIGVTRGRGLKFGLALPIDPRENSDDAMRAHVMAIKDLGEDLLGVLAQDDDTLPCVQRVWRLKPFTEDVVELAAAAWLKVGNALQECSEWLGFTRPELSLNCLHASENVQIKMYDRKRLGEWYNASPEASTGA